MPMPLRGMSMCAAVALTVCATSGCSGSSGTVAQIDGKVVSVSKLNHWMPLADHADVAAHASHSGLRSRVLGFLIFSCWVETEAHALGVKVSSTDASRELELLKIDEAEGLTYARLPHELELSRLLIYARPAKSDRLWLIKLSLLEPRLEAALAANARRAIPRRLIDSYYQRHTQQFYLPEQRDLEIIVNEDATSMRRARREIEKGVPFLTVAHSISSDSEAPDGLWHLERGHDERPFEDAIFPAKPHVLVGPIKYNVDPQVHYRYFMFEVLNGSSAREQTVAEAEGRIRRQLTPPANVILSAFEARWIPRTSCRASFVMQRCRQDKNVTQPFAQHRRSP